MMGKEDTLTAGIIATPATTVIAVVEQLDKANSIFYNAISNEKKRKELLEQALIAYADALLYADPITARAILGKIHAIEQWLELLISNSSNYSSNSNSNSTALLAGEEEKGWF